MIELAATLIVIYLLGRAALFVIFFVMEWLGI